MLTLLPNIGKRTSPSDVVHRPYSRFSCHRASRAFTTYRASPRGTRPFSVTSSFASFTMPWTVSRPPAPLRPPALDGRVAAATHWLFRLLSRERRRRVFHPQGVAFRCDVRLEDGPFGEAGTDPGLVRFSRGLGLPRPFRDVLGLALRIVDAHGPGAPQDLLFASSLLRVVPAPAHTFLGPRFSTLLPFRVEGRLCIIVAATTPPVGATGAEPLAALQRAAGKGPVRFRLSLVPGHRPLGELVLGERLPSTEAARLRLNPYNTGPLAVPVWLPNRLRDPAYRGSQEGRPIPGRSSEEEEALAGHAGPGRPDDVTSA